MTLKSKYLHTQISELEISRFRFYSGLIVGFLTSIIFYGFLYGLREAFRISSISEEYDIWILSDSEVNFYNLFFAFIAIIYGHSVCINHWLETPRRLRDNFYRRRFSIINDFRGNSWIYISWFVRITTLLGFLYCFTFEYWFYAFEIFPKYNSLLILFIVVLYFNTWNTIRLIFKNQSYKWTILWLIITISIAFTMSRFNLYDYKKLNNRVLSKSIYNNYTLNIPQVDFHERLYNWSLVYNLYVAESKDSSQRTILWADGEEIELKDIRFKVAEWREWLAESDQPKMTVKLNIHFETNMSIVNAIKEELRKCSVLRIGYAVAPSNTNIDPRFYRYHTINSKMIPYGAPFFDSEEYYNEINAHEDPVLLQHLEFKDSISYKGNHIHISDLKDRLKADITANPRYLIKYYFKDSLEYENYISVISCTKESIKELRNSYSLEHFSVEFDELHWHELYWDKAREIERLYHYRLLEINEEFAKKLDW